MHPHVLEFLDAQRVCVLAIEMLDGSPHAAVVHFARTPESFFLFETNRNYRKAEPLLATGTARASLAVGFEESAKSRTFQADGSVRLLSEKDTEYIEKYLHKFPNKRAKAEDPENLFFSFTPQWWRFTDWSGPEGKTIYISDGTIVVAGKHTQG